MKKLLFFCCMMLAFCADIPAQSRYAPYGNSGEKPEWAAEMISMDLAHSYLETVMVRGKSQKEVREEAARVIAERRNLTTGAVMLNTTPEASDGLIVSSKLEREYWEYDGAYFRGYFLFQTRKLRKYDFHSVNITESYPFSPRVFVPGMAQIYKGSKVKGTLFIAGEAALIGGVVIAENLRASYISKINTTHSAADKLTYNSNADSWQNIRNGLIAGAAALYVWNVVDGWAARGKTHIVIGDSRLRIAPYATPQAGGVALTLNF
jgi:hypothetical protein